GVEVIVVVVGAIRAVRAVRAVGPVRPVRAVGPVRPIAAMRIEDGYRGCCGAFGGILHEREPLAGCGGVWWRRGEGGGSRDGCGEDAQQEGELHIVSFRGSRAALGARRRL